MQSLYQCDLSYVQAAAFGTLAQGAATEIARRLRSTTAPVRKVLDVGCGAGVLAKALTDAGFEVTGVDTSSDLLEFARTSAPKAHFRHASAYDTQIAGYDAVVAIGEVLAYHAASAEADKLLTSFFQRCADGLPPGGMLIFDVIGLGEPSLAARTWRSGDDWAVLVETTEKQADRILIREIEVFRRTDGLYRRSGEVHAVRLFEVTKLCEQLAYMGFATETACSYGTQELPPRRHAVFATRLATRKEIVGRGV
jgi:2-polyprenyl-3-methyl-5-hydroxy-6-metoxy-1,4-benzoquinol methylase